MLSAVTVVALRVLAVFIAAWGVAHLATLASWIINPSALDKGFPLMTLAACWLVGPAVVAVVLWLIAPWLARQILRDIETKPSPSLDIEPMVSAAFVVAGVFIFVTALPAFTGYLLSVLESPDQVAMKWLAVDGLRCLLGIALVVGARSTARFCLWLRSAGTNV